MMRMVTDLTSTLIHRQSDCDDTQATVYPGAEELLDGLDNDCNSYLETDNQDNNGLMDWHEWTLGSDHLILIAIKTHG